jgi:hypothetical protein
MTSDSNLKTAVLELLKMFSEHLPAEDVPGILRKAVENALAEVLGDTPKRLGRPPRGAATSTTAIPKKKGRSPASRAKQAAKMRAYWKAKKAAEAAPKQKRGKSAKAAGDSPGATQGGT